MDNIVLSTARQFDMDMFNPVLFRSLNESICRSLLDNGVRSQKYSPAHFCSATSKALKQIDKSVDSDVIEELKLLSKVEIADTPLPPMVDYIDKRSEFFVYLIHNYFTCLISYAYSLYENDTDTNIAYHSLYNVIKGLDQIIDNNTLTDEGEKPEQIIRRYFVLSLYATHTIIVAFHRKNIDFTVLTQAEIEYKLINTMETDVLGVAKTKDSFIQYKDENPELFYDEQVEINIIRTSATIAPPVTSFHSFKLKKHLLKKDCLTDIRDTLHLYGFIKKEQTSLKAFRKVFSGDKVEKPIVWTANKSTFAYFIKQLHNNLKLVEDLKQNQWIVACKCFVQNDGSPFETKIRKLPKPTNGIDEINKALRHLQ